MFDAIRDSHHLIRKPVDSCRRTEMKIAQTRSAIIQKMFNVARNKMKSFLNSSSKDSEDSNMNKINDLKRRTQ